MPSVLQPSLFAAHAAKIYVCSIARNLQQSKFFLVQKPKRGKRTLGLLSIRKFPVDLRELINRTVGHLKVDRDDFVAKLLRHDLKQIGATFAEVDQRLEEIQRWWTSIEREDVE